MAERLVVTQALCDKVSKLSVRGLEIKEIVEILGISQSTVSRIQAAHFSAEQFKAMTEARRKTAQDKQKAREQLDKMEKYMADIQATEEATAELLKENEALKAQAQQVPGQLKMDLPDATEALRKSAGYTVIESMIYDNVMKIEKAEYASAERVIAKLNGIYDMLGQILRAIRKE